MPFTVRSFRRFPVRCTVTYHAGPFQGQGNHMNPSQSHPRIDCILAGALFVLLYILGCSSAQLVTRPVRTESTWFVRLDSFQEPEKSRVLEYDHPAEWNDPELVTILSRLLVQPDMGLLDRKRPATPVFSAEEIIRLAPFLRTAFHEAQASEWVSFMFSYPTGTNLEITSGAFFITNRRLHVVVANTREVVHQSAMDVGLVRKNPMRSIHGLRGHLTFDPARFIVETTSNWSGGSNMSAGELVLDYREIHILTTPLVSPTPAVSISTGPSRASQESATTANSGVVAERDFVRENRQLQTEVEGLKTQIDILNRRLNEQESVLLQLRKDLDAARSTQTRERRRPSP